MIKSQDTAELIRLGRAPHVPARGGLAPWAERRCLELLRARISEDISLDELAAEVRLSRFHFARMFKQSIGVPPRVYLTIMRMEKACELLETTDEPITEIAFDVGYSSNQVFARVFQKHRHMSPSEYRRAVRDPLAQLPVPDRSSVTVNVINAPLGTTATTHQRCRPGGGVIIDVMLAGIDDGVAGLVNGKRQINMAVNDL
ncbi:AraC family transcriptional regulator [Devosia sp. 1635]|uniref:helix-turn-helix domain-containing protein n=1 Tax=Devosia sp. 1635 TaxID=2726066 RepID=UPI0020C0A0D6|nr:AraC family transcriptional regulator [Devosia sp. 1635]